MSSDRCPYYYWDGDWQCRNRRDSCTLHLYDTYCSNPRRCHECDYYRR